jgi:ribosomal protein L37AE/L43A
MSSRMAPHYCPYCGDEDLRPAETEGQWECRDCARFFAVKFVGLSADALAAVHADQGASS